MNLPALREIKDTKGFGPKDTLVIFGEFFKGGYISGLIRSAQKKGMNIIYSTMGRRDPKGQLRKLLPEEWQEPAFHHNTQKIEVPLEAGFDMEPSESGKRPIDLCQDIKLNEWEKASLDPLILESAKKRARTSFENRVKEWLNQLEKLLPQEGNVLIAHTMAGGVPRSKIFMPILNRILKGRGQRFVSSEMFWHKDLGKLCSANFDEVTAQTFKALISLSTPLRHKLKQAHRSISYTAYSYHGTEVLMDKNYVWQTYSPYLQGFAKINLEKISEEFFAQGVHTCVFNVPEILTRSSSVFPGVEIPLYTLLGAFQKDGGVKGEAILNKVLKKLKKEALTLIMESTKKYFESPAIKQNSQFKKWPQHNSLPQMEQMLKLSQTLFELNNQATEGITPLLSEVVLNSTGRLILQEMARLNQPVCWLNHDIIARDVQKRGA